MAGKFELKKTSNEQYHFVLKASNGKVILSSETYRAKSSAEDGIASVRANAKNDDRYESLKSRNGQHYFNLKASNGQVIGTSEMYTTSTARDEGITSVKNNGTTPDIDDLT